jgi:uncharacterized protein (TIGR00299 family) protein
MSTDKQIVVIDCQAAGISGDMILGALVDLGADLRKIDQAMKCVRESLKGCRTLQLTAREVTRRGFRAKKVDINVDDVAGRSGKELKEGLASSLEKLRLSTEANRLATGTLDTLVTTETALHGGRFDEVHLHEAGSADTIADIIGTVVALDDLGLLQSVAVHSTPVAVGRGLLTFSHGTVSTPAPATLEILRSKAFPMIGGPLEVELATPTGVSLLTNLVNTEGSSYPPMRPGKVGYGAGAADFAEVPNILRIVVGEPLEYGFAGDEVRVLETNLDDVPGEVIGYAVDRLLEEGAKDVSVIPMFTKKNRPGQIIKVIADKKDAEHLTRVLVEETGTLGVRESPCRRHILLREVTSVNVRIYETSAPVRVKIARNLNGKIVRIKPEYDDVRKLAKEARVPYRTAMEMAERKARSLTEK